MLPRWLSRKRHNHGLLNEIFTKVNKRKKKFVDLSVVTPCKSVLYYHTLRANTVSMIWKRAVRRNVILPNFKIFGWEEIGELLWINEHFLEDVEVIMFDSRYQDQYYYGSGNESNNQLDKFDALSIKSM